MRLKHINIVARDADALAAFHAQVFGCFDIRPRRTLSGDRVASGMGLAQATVHSVWLALPGADAPFLELHQHSRAVDLPDPPVNRAGYGHLAFEVANIEATRDAVLAAGGRSLGTLTNLGDDARPFLAVYLRDPEGNIIELAPPTP